MTSVATRDSDPIDGHDLHTQVEGSLASSDPQHGQTSRKRKTSMSKEEFVTILSHAGAQNPQSSTLLSPSAHRSQMQAALVHSFLHKTRATYPQFEWLRDVAPGSRAMTSALDAWCLFELGRTKNDVRYQHAAISTQGAAIRYMSAELSLPESRRRTAHIIGAAYMLQICDFFAIDNKNVDGLRWRVHAQAISQVLGLTKTSNLDAGIFAVTNWSPRYFLLWDALLSRKRVGCLPLLDARPIEPVMDCFAELYNISFRVPGALECCDILRGKAAKGQRSQQRAEFLLRSIARLESRLKAWTAVRYKERPDFEPSEICLERATFPVFNPASPILTTTFDFIDFSAALAHQVHWLCLLNLAEAQRHILQDCLLQLPTTASSDSPSNKDDDPQVQDLANRSELYADSLCKSVSFLRNERDGTWALLAAVGPLYFASLHYMRENRTEKLRWTVNAAMELERLGICTPFRLENE